MSDAIRRAEFHFEGSAGRRLFGRSWEPPEAQRDVVLVHGYGEHSGRYDHLGAWFAARGTRVLAYDHQGHGRSQGVRAHVRRFSDLLDDLAHAVELARSARPAGAAAPPLYLLGHSMGGLVVCAFARERQPDVTGLVVSAPALAVPDGVGVLRRVLLRTLRWVAPSLSLASGLDPGGLSRDPRVVAAYVSDPLVHRRMTLSLGAELFGAIARTAGGGAEVALPLLMLHGSDDPICSPDASAAFARAAPRGRYLAYSGLRHEIFNEPEHTEVLADVQRWIEALERPRASDPARRDRGPSPVGRRAPVGRAP